MKKLFTFVFLLAVLVTSCGPKPEEQVKKFAVKFGDFINTNQKDSIQKYYPAFELKDFLASIALSNITVTPADSEGKYLVYYSPNTSITVKNDRGQVEVLESRGLFEYPENKIDIAKKTGLWDDSLSDVELSQRMNDEEFFDYINKKFDFNPAKILTVNTKFKITSTDNLGTASAYYGYCTITNNTDKTIYPSDYKINLKDYEGSAWDGDNEKRYSEEGIEINPNSTIKIEGSTLQAPMRNEESHILTGVTILLTPEEIQERFNSFTGNEYQEYLHSKK